MTQGEFWDDPDDNDRKDDIPARHDDPPTSQAAATRARADNPVGRFRLMGRGGFQTYQAKLLQLYGGVQIQFKGDFVPKLDEPLGDSRGYTDIEAAGKIRREGARHANMESARRRGSDLRDAGFIKDSGIRRSNAGSPDEAMVCIITEEGWIALRKLRDNGRTY